MFDEVVRGGQTQPVGASDDDLLPMRPAAPWRHFYVDGAFSVAKRGRRPPASARREPYANTLFGTDMKLRGSHECVCCSSDVWWAVGPQRVAGRWGQIQVGSGSHGRLSLSCGADIGVGWPDPGGAMARWLCPRVVHLKGLLAGSAGVVLLEAGAAVSAASSVVDVVTSFLTVAAP